MFIGHFGAGLAAKRIAPSVSLGTLFLSVQFVDLLWPLFLLLGLEQVRIDPGNTVVTPLDFCDYPISHSLIGVIGWSLALGGAYLLLRGGKRGAVVVAAGVASHWFLDLVVHVPDLPLLPGGPYVGLGLWNSTAGTVVVEFFILTAGIVVYVAKTLAKDRTGRYAFRSLIGLLVLIQLGNLMGPPPPSEIVIAWVGLAQWLLVAWAYWVDRHRTVEM